MVELPLALLVGAFFAASIYLLLSRSIIRLLMGVVLLGNAVNLLIFTIGRLTREIPPFITTGTRQYIDVIANPLPQALILTAIVISFSIFAFILVLSFRAYQELGSDDTDDLRVAEPVSVAYPPEGY
jgi:multicomponent Na+:H+ antiporter subunit C